MQLYQEIVIFDTKKLFQNTCTSRKVAGINKNTQLPILQLPHFINRQILKFILSPKKLHILRIFSKGELFVPTAFNCVIVLIIACFYVIFSGFCMLQFCLTLLEMQYRNYDRSPCRGPPAPRAQRRTQIRHCPTRAENFLVFRILNTGFNLFRPLPVGKNRTILKTE